MDIKCAKMTTKNRTVNLLDRLVKQWSPLIWMSPEEKYMPLSIEEFFGACLCGRRKRRKDKNLFHQNVDRRFHVISSHTSAFGYDINVQKTILYAHIVNH
ncbi:hypothetical protein NQ317_005504 [Molorchus minor]|uniref:Uncharacterized protein n=1 Tax=Molorchus minor TaxID=1323400 RepID=A0ABQ9IV07_9CUCU|nr:hypothetical protein NQ317_005504 [Molorchus minor]